VCKDKKKGGWGIKNLRKINISLLCKWWWYLENEEGQWQDIIRIKYLKGSPVCVVQSKVSDSPVWKDLMKIRHIYLKGREFDLGNGRMVSFWLDPWLDGIPICMEYPILCELALNQKCSVNDMVAT
jgi:hypothetical protein